MVKKIEQLRTNTAVKDSRKTPTAQAVPHAPVTVHSAESELDSAHSDFVRARDRLLDAAGFGATNPWPTWTRNICAMIASVTIGYGIYALGKVLIDMLVVAIGGTALSTLSVTAFTALGAATMAIYIVGFLLAILLMYVAGKYIGGAIASGAVDRTIVRWCKAPFARRDIELAAAAA